MTSFDLTDLLKVESEPSNKVVNFGTLEKKEITEIIMKTARAWIEIMVY